MHCGSVNIPDSVIRALEEGNLVIFAGAGVSMGKPARLPNFSKLADMIAKDTGTKRDKKEPLERFLGRLHSKKVNIKQRAKDILKVGTHTQLHTDLLRLFKKNDQIRIVTTNFDTLFEDAGKKLWSEEPEVYSAPALPQGHNFHGIVHLHGTLSALDTIVLTDIDFGRAYITEGWAARFLLETYKTFTVLFVGYSHEDTVMQYLSRAMPPENEKRRYALVSNPNDHEKWEFLGIEPITFTDDRKFSILGSLVRRIGDIRNLGTDGWERELSEIAATPRPLDPEKRDLLKHAFQESWRVKLFARHASPVEWASWLDSEKHLDSLFEDTHLDEVSQIIMRWVIDDRTLNLPDQFLLVLGHHKNRMSPDLWRQLAGLLHEKSSGLEDRLFLKWVGVLLSAQARHYEPIGFLWLAERLSERGMHQIILEIFSRMAKPQLRIESELTSFFARWIY